MDLTPTFTTYLRSCHAPVVIGFRRDNVKLAISFRLEGVDLYSPISFAALMLLTQSLGLWLNTTD